MKFEEKLIKLRRENALSQEDLAEKLDVTRQTVSKWELGQSKPDFDKLVEISKLFNVSMEKLTDDNNNLNDETKTKKQGENNNLKIALIIIAVAIGGYLLLNLIFTVVFASKVNGVIGNSIVRIFKLANDELDEYEKSKKNGEFQNIFNETMNWIETKAEEIEQERKEDYNITEEEIDQQYEEKSQDLVKSFEEKNNDALQKQEQWYQEQVQKQEQWYQEQVEKQKQAQEEWKKQNWPEWAQ